MKVNQSLLELIGAMPMVKAQRLDTDVCDLYPELGCMHAGGSIVRLSRGEIVDVHRTAS